MVVVLISHSNVNNTISNGLVHIWCGKYIYESSLTEGGSKERLRRAELLENRNIRHVK